MKSFLALIAVTLSTSSIAADLTSVGVTAGTSQTCSGVAEKQTFFTSTFDFYYTGGNVILSSNADGTGGTYVDDQIIIQIKRPDGTARIYQYIYPQSDLPPKNLKTRFQVGLNKVTVRLKDYYGGCAWSTPIWLTNQ